VTLEGVDYSSTANGDWTALANALKVQGKQFVGRYAVNDKSPNGRGISAAEYQAMTAAGIDTFLYWESSEGWMLGGFAAGVYAAQNAQANLLAAGMPETTPVYMACDVDASPDDQAAIDDCLRGAAEVIGPERVGIYGGYHVIKRCKENGTATWFCQTSAWSGGMLLPEAHLYQYAYNQYFAGTNCDLVRAYQLNYGQASPVVIDVVPPAVPSVPWDTTAIGPQTINGRPALAFLGEAKAKRAVKLRLTATSTGKILHVVKVGENVVIRGSLRAANGHKWAFVDVPGRPDLGTCRAPLSAFFGPWPVI